MTIKTLNGLSLNEVTVNGKSALLLRDRDNFIVEKVDLVDIIEKLNVFYEMDEERLNRVINKSNRSVYLANLGCASEDNIYKFMGQIIYEQKKFNPKRKRERTFNCDCCNHVIDSRVVDHYYRISEMIIDLEDEKACSEACIKVIWKEWVNNRLKENGFATL